jgi:beta-glucanase (GH16 family)
MADPSTGPYNPFTIMGNQYLRIRAIKAPPGTVDPEGWNRTYESGMLSAGHVNGTAVGSVSDGYYEARIMLPAEIGTWPAFWNLSQDSTGANRLSTASELDTMEGYGQFPATFCQTWHYWGNPATGNGTCNSGGTPYTTDPGTYGDNDMSTWHTYGLKITPTDVIWYIDNHETWRVPATQQSQDLQFFMINLELGSGWPIDLTRYNNQADMFVDWVRVFKPVGTLGTYRLVNRSSGQTLDVQSSSKSTGAALVQEPQNGASSQQWKYAVDPQDNGYYNLINQNSGKGANAQGSEGGNGLPIIQRPNLIRSNEEWQLAPTGDGYYKIVRAFSNGTKVMDVTSSSNTAGAAIIQNTWNGSQSQEWRLIPVS